MTMIVDMIVLSPVKKELFYAPSLVWHDKGLGREKCS